MFKFLKNLFKKSPPPIELPIVVYEEKAIEIQPLIDYKPFVIPENPVYHAIEDVINAITIQNDPRMLDSRSPSAWGLEKISKSEEVDDEDEIELEEEIIECRAIEKSEYAKVDLIDHEPDWKKHNIQWLLMPNNTPMKVLDVDYRGILLRWGRAQSVKNIPWRDLIHDCKWSEDKKIWKRFNEK